MVEFHKFVKLNIVCEYSSTAGAIAEMKSNALYMVGGAVNAGAYWTGSVRLRFCDQ